MTEQEIQRIFLEAKALLSGHFLLSSGLHSDAYLEKFRVFEQPKIHERLIAELLSRFDTSSVETVIGPALGGVIMAAEAARQLSVRAVYAEKEGSALTLRRGFVISKGERVLILDDIVTTGGSLLETISIAQNAEAEIIGVGVLADRSGGKVQIPANYQPLMRVKLEVFKPETCPLCAANRPLTKPGSRKL